MFDSSKLMYSSGADFYSHPIDQSLRFNYADSGSLTWTPSSSGNRKTWTWSVWAKLNTSSGRGILEAASDASNRFMFYYGNGGALSIRQDNDYISLGARLVRDYSGWYHFVVSVDTTQATASDRVKLYINGEEATELAGTYPAQNSDTHVNNTVQHSVGRAFQYRPFQGYLAEVNFIDGTALDASSFGETKSGVWIPKAYSGSYGTNGFYLPFNHDYSVEGFSATTWTGVGGPQYVGGVGFSPDLVWVKNRSSATEHCIHDSVRGAQYLLDSGSTNAELSRPTYLSSFENDGFYLNDNVSNYNASGNQYVAWCWDAGSGSPVSNTDGSITSTVKANPTYGFSVVSYTGNSGGGTVGHGLSSAPEMIFIKDRDRALDWVAYTTAIDGSLDYGKLNLTNYFNNASPSAPTSSVFSIGAQGVIEDNYSGDGFIAYCFHSVSGYSKIGSYSGTGSAGNSVTTGFKPAFVLIKDTTNSGNSWIIFDSARDPNDPRSSALAPDGTYVEFEATGYISSFDSDGFTVAGAGAINGSGATMIYMAFADKREAAFWLDQSGNNNDFTNNNLTESDISLDSPTNNFATLNPLVYSENSNTFTEGNLKYSSSGNNQQVATIAMQGKVYWEFRELTSNNSGLAFSEDSDFTTKMYYNATNKARLYNDATSDYSGALSWTVNSGSLFSWTTNDIIGVAYDADNHTLELTKNGGSAVNLTINGLSGDTMLAVHINRTSSTSTSIHANFGQDSSFAGAVTAQGNTDANGYGDFYYAPPTGYLALCTANIQNDMPASIDPAQDGSPQDHFNTVLYTGNETGQTITGVGFDPDFGWIKNRSDAVTHILSDNVRGSTYYLQSNATSAEGTSSSWGGLTTDGYSLTGGSGIVNNGGDAYVAWGWKANGSGVSNTDGSITSTVSANTDAGFSIVSYTGNGTAGATVGHGLGTVPSMVILKSRTVTTNWYVWHQNLTQPDYQVYLNLTSGQDNTGITAFNDKAPTSTVFELPATGYGSNNASATYVAYCFAEVEGFSKFGSYTGNGSTDGTFVYTGFRPAFVMTKSTASGSWSMTDTSRDSYNLTTNKIEANTALAEAGNAGLYQFDILSNGFKQRQTTGYGSNNTGVTYIYMAFAENPFKYANAR